jgi:hypothetical protein
VAADAGISLCNARKKYDVDLAKLKDVTRSVARRCSGTDFEPAIEWCDSILAAIEGLEVGVDRNASMHLLGHAALNLNQTLLAGKYSLTAFVSRHHLSAIDATVRHRQSPQGSSRRWRHAWRSV